MSDLGPVAASERMDSIDLVRGYALLGVLLMNVQYWFRNPPQLYWLGGHPFAGHLNLAADVVLRFWFEAKSVTLFSMLFAFGLCVQRERTLAKGLRWSLYASRRLTAMLLFGVLHIVFAWNGDILHWYAICALLVLPFLSREARTIRRWIFAILGIAITGILVASIIQMLHAAPPKEATSAQPELRAWADACIQGYRQSSWIAVMKFRLRDYVHIFISPMMLSFVLFTFLNFLIGIWIFKEAVIQEAQGRLSPIGRFSIWMLGAGIFFGLVIAVQMEARPFLLAHWHWTRWFIPIFGLAQVLGIQSMALGIGAGLVYLWHRPRWTPMLRPLLPMGRMAFTNYILQSVVSTFVFYGWGLGFYNQMGPAMGMAFSFALFGVQIVLSGWWLKRFRFGPLEWLWRCLTYGELQPFRIRA